MPEGDTVWRTARTLDRALSGRVLLRSDFRVPAFATVDLAGRMVTGTVARGKHLLTRVAGGGGEVTVHTHLLMEGAWHLYRPGSRWRRPVHSARLVLGTAEWTGVGFSLGIVQVLPRESEQEAFGHLGPDLLGPDWDAQEAARRLAADPARPVGQALLDQRNLAGVGNMYAAELCFLQGVGPWLPVGEVRDLAALVRRAKVVLEANKQRVEQTTTGDSRPGRRLWVYGRGSQPCRRCGVPITRAPLPSDVSDGARSVGQARQRRETYWCPSCQRVRR